MIAANIQAKFEQDQNHDLTFFAVYNEVKAENRVQTDCISPFFETREQALSFKAQALAEYPNCLVGKYTAEYSSEHDEKRQELLAKIVKAPTSKQLLEQLQQALDSTIGVISSVHATQFEYALDCIQTTIDHFNERVIDGCTQQVADILGFQLEEILTAASELVLTLTTNEFSPRAKIGQRLVMRLGVSAEDGDLVAIKLGDKWLVEWFKPGKAYDAVCMAIMARERAQQDEPAELQA